MTQVTHRSDASEDPVGHPPSGGLVATTARGLTAAGVLLSAVVHLELWAVGMRDVAIIGPGFLLNAVSGLVIALAVLLWEHWLPLLTALGFGAATLGAFVASVTVGLFGVEGTLAGVPQVLAASGEVVAIGFAVVGLLALRARQTRDGRMRRG